jgi:hypothetical protein
LIISVGKGDAGRRDVDVVRGTHAGVVDGFQQWYDRWVRLAG